MDEHDVRRRALALPEAVEADHQGFPSFRVRNRIFATLPGDGQLRLMLAEEDIRAAVAEWPQWCGEQWWGKRLAALRVDLAHADDGVVAELLTDAWRRKAPARLLG